MDDRSFSEIISELQVLIEDVALLAKESDIEREILSGLSLVAEKFRPILNDLKDDSKVKDTSPIRKAIRSLDKEFLRAKNLIKSPNSRVHMTRIGSLTRDIGRSLGLVLLARLDVSADIKEKIGTLHKELMNPGFASGLVASPSLSSGSGFDSESEFEEEMEIVEVERRRRSLGIEDVTLQVKYGDDEELKLALLALWNMIDSELVNDEWIHDQAVIPILISRLSSGVPHNRLTTVQLLRKLASSNATHKEKMADVDSLSVLVRSLTRDMEERREAVALLLSLSDLSPVRRHIGRIQGCIVMLVAIFNGDDSEASQDAGKLLNALSSNTQNALHMAEAGYFKPLVHYLKEGSDMCKILMAAALSRMDLTDQSKALLGEEGAINPLVKMFIGGKLEAKLSSLNALQKLSSLTENTQRLVTSGIVSPLLQLLFSVTSVLMTLREPASAILARIAQSESILVNPDVAQQMLSLLNLSSPVIQYHLLQALYNITVHPSASKVRRKMKENGAIQLLLPFLSETSLKIRTSALKLFYILSKDSSNELTEELGESYIKTIVNIIVSSVCQEEKATAVGILSNLPVSDKKATDVMKKLDLLSILMSTVAIGSGECSLAEGIAGILIRFTVPSDKKLQHFAAEHGVIPFLMEILSSGSPLAKARAATALAQLSQNTYSLRKSRKSMWFCMPPSSEAFCHVHDSYCFVKTTFCLVKASAISPLIQILDGNDREADEAVIDALATLVKDETWENGSDCLVKMSAVPAIIKVIEFGNERAQEKALLILETIFKNEEHRKQHGESAQVVLIDLAQRVNSRLKSIVARVLAQLELLQVQSSYF